MEAIAFRMATIVVHFVAGVLGSLAVFVLFWRLSGAERTSAPLGLLFIGIACAGLAHYVSEWATLVVIAVYAAINAAEYVQDRNRRR